MEGLGVVVCAAAIAFVSEPMGTDRKGGIVACIRFDSQQGFTSATSEREVGLYEQERRHSGTSPAAVCLTRNRYDTDLPKEKGILFFRCRVFGVSHHRWAASK